MRKGNTCVLVVRDDICLRESLVSDLERGGFRCLEAASRREVAGLLHHTVPLPEVALLDLTSPSAGLGVLEELKKNVRWRRIRVIVLSARSEERTILEALRWGAIDYLVKPYDPCNLLTRVERAARMALV